MSKTTFQLNSFSSIKKTIAIMSSKGGVGKSTISSLIATHMQKIGLSVGILDADIIGPTISQIFGINTTLLGENNLLKPAVSFTGIKVVSSQLLLEKNSDPILWRAPLVLDLIRQFYVDIIWGDLDYLLIDMPPGTGDVSLTVLESLNVDGVIIITSPQDIVNQIVSKGVQMTRIIKKPLLGIIENYSYLICDQCEKKHYLFGADNTPELIKEFNVPLLGQIPIQPMLAKAIDHGKIETIDEPMIHKIVQQIKELTT
jgi:Mrp family chromosome partitioning ATPase